MNDAPMDAIQSRYLGGKLNLWQAAKGYRAAVDPALLAASLKLRPGAMAVEFGCGPGAALLSAAYLNQEVSFLGIEADPTAAKLAERNCDHPDFTGRVDIICGDIHHWRGPESGQIGSGIGVDAIFFNPPFFDDATALRAPSEAKSAAWINESSLSEWITSALRRLKEGGRLTVIQRADRLGDILSALAPKAGGVLVLPVHAKAEEAAKRVIVSAVKTSKAPMQILPGLILHDADGRYTAEADAILRGEGRTALAR